MKLIFTENPRPMPNMRAWRAVKRGHSFVILLEEQMGREVRRVDRLLALLEKASERPHETHPTAFLRFAR